MNINEQVFYARMPKAPLGTTLSDTHIIEQGTKCQFRFKVRWYFLPFYWIKYAIASIRTGAYVHVNTDTTPVTMDGQGKVYVTDDDERGQVH